MINLSSQIKLALIITNRHNVLMAFQIDIKNKYVRFSIIWILLAIIMFAILTYLNQWLEVSPFVLVLIAVGVTGFLTGWVFRNTYFE